MSSCNLESNVENKKSNSREKHIEFKNKYRNLILKGLKNSTIRNKINFKEGDEVYVHCGGEIIGKATITEVKEVRFEDLNDEIAVSDGFKNVEDLKNEIKKIYGDIDKVHLIRFNFKPFERPKRPEEMYYGNLTPVEIAEKALSTLKLSDDERYILELLLKTKSIKKTAIKLGGVWKRKDVREVLRKCYKLLSKIDTKDG